MLVVVAFVRHLLDDLQGVANVDRRRVFATGMSNGAMMAYRVAAEMSDRIAAFAPFAGGKGRGPSGTDFYSVDHSIGAWVDANGCRKTPLVTQLPDREQDGTTVKQVRYASGRDGAEVVMVVVEGGGHTWPGREPRMRSLGVSTRDISANDMMWEFFRRHPMK